MSLLFFLFFISIPFYLSYRFSSSLTGTKSWEYLGKFCFDYIENNKIENNKIYSGRIYINFTTSIIYNDLILLYYNDIYNNNALIDKINDLHCYEKIALANKTIPLSFKTSHLYTDEIIFHDSPHYILFALSSSSCQHLPPDIRYNVHFINPLSGKSHEELSVDKRGIVELYFTFFILSLILIGLQSQNFHNKKKKKLLNHEMHLLTIVLVEFCVSTFFYLLHYGVYSYNGMGFFLFQGFAFLVQIFYQFTFFLLICSIAALSFLQLNLALMIPVFLLAAGYFSSYAYCYFIREETTIQFYDSPQGINFLILDCLCGLWLFYVIFISRRVDRNPTYFLQSAYLFVPWFFINTIATLLALTLKPYNREFFVLITISIFECAYFIAVMRYIWTFKSPYTNDEPFRSRFRADSHKDVQIELDGRN